jgi:uncharacterized hydrophobic protein (TIGR00271 family)
MAHRRLLERTDVTDRSNRNRLVSELRENARPTVAFYLLGTASCAIATFGLLENSAAVIIGAMLIAPLMTPIVALGFGLVDGDVVVLRDAIVALGSGSLLAVALSALLALVTQLPDPGSEILGRGHPTLLDLGIALFAGGIAGYARINRGIAETVGGASIAVALMPPLCVVGIGLSLQRWELAYGALLLFLTNLVGITLACALVFEARGVATGGSRRALLIGAGAVVLIAIPLGYGTIQLVEQQRLEAVLRAALVNDTQTFKRVELAGTTIDWLRKPIVVTLLVRASDPVTPGQVRSLQQFAQNRIGHKLTLVIDVSPITRVDASEPTPSPSPAAGG